MSLTDDQLTRSRRLLQALDRELRRRPKGAITDMEHAIGVKTGKGWWQNRLKTGYLTTAQMVAILEHLGLNPVRFMRDTLGSKESLELDRPWGPPPEIVQRARQRLETGHEGDIGQGYLDAMGQRRYRDPRRVLEQTTSIVDHVKLELLSELLGIAGSSYRICAQLNEAEHAMHAAIDCALRFNDLGRVAQLILRLSYVWADRGEYETSLLLTEKVMSMNLRAGDSLAFTRTLVTYGSWLTYLGRYQEAIALFTMALDRLPTGEERHIFASLQKLAVNYRELGDLETALTYLSKAQDMAESQGDWARDKLLWIRANIYTDLGRFDEGAASLEVVLESFTKTDNLIDAALVACDLIEIHLRQKQGDLAYKVALGLLMVLEPLKGNKIVSAAIAELLRGGQGGLTLALTRRVRARIKGERRAGHSFQ